MAFLAACGLALRTAPLRHTPLQPLTAVSPLSFPRSPPNPANNKMLVFWFFFFFKTGSPCSICFFQITFPIFSCSQPPGLCSKDERCSPAGMAMAGKLVGGSHQAPSMFPLFSGRFFRTSDLDDPRFPLLSTASAV